MFLHLNPPPLARDDEVRRCQQATGALEPSPLGHGRLSAGSGSIKSPPLGHGRSSGDNKSIRISRCEPPDPLAELVAAEAGDPEAVVSAFLRRS